MLSKFYFWLNSQNIYFSAIDTSRSSLISDLTYSACIIKTGNISDFLTNKNWMEVQRKSGKKEELTFLFLGFL